MKRGTSSPIRGGRWRIYRLLAPLVLLSVLPSCGITRSDGGFFCSDPCPDSDRVRDFFCDCVPKTDDDDLLRTVLKVTRGQCTPSGEQVFFFNNTGSDVEAERVTQIAEGTDTQYLRDWIHLERGEKQRVGCDVRGGSQTTLITVGRIRRLRTSDLMSPRYDDGKAWMAAASGRSGARTLYGRIALAYWRPVSLRMAQAADTGAQSCKTICGTAPELCTSAELPAYVATGLRRLRSELLVPGRTRLAMSTLHDLFAISDGDTQCERSAVRFEEGRLESSGEPCVLSTDLTQALAEPAPAMVLAQIAVPEELEGQWSFIPLTADFSASPSRPSISIRDSDAVLFQGDITQVEATSHHLFVELAELGAGRTCWDLVIDSHISGRMNIENAALSRQRPLSAAPGSTSFIGPDRAGH